MQSSFSQNDTDNVINITIGGDFCPMDRVKGVAVAALFPASVKEIFRQSDLKIVNLECPLTTVETSIYKTGQCLKADPEAVKMLTHLDINLVTLANNHIRDFGDNGVKDTLVLCKENGIDTVGAGGSLCEARKIYYQHIKQRLLAVINVTENEFANAKPLRAGANPLDFISLLEDIREARKNADHVLLILHGGLEYTHYPSPQSVRLLRFLAEQGLTAIIRHHPHFVQGVEVWKGVPIFYSLGNFLFDCATEKRSAWFGGILVTLEIDPENHCNFDVHPFNQCKDELVVRLLGGIEKDNFLKRFQEFSEVLHNEKAIEHVWNELLAEKRDSIYARLALPNYFLFRVARKLRLLQNVRPPLPKKILLENYIRCEAHREFIIDLFERDHSDYK